MYTNWDKYDIYKYILYTYVIYNSILIIVNCILYYVFCNSWLYAYDKYTVYIVYIIQKEIYNLLV